MAEKFKILKEQERNTRAELLAFNGAYWIAAWFDHTLNIQREETALEARHSEITGIDRDLEQMRTNNVPRKMRFQEVQRRFYAVGNEITRIEQDVLHHQGTPDTMGKRFASGGS